MYGANHYIMPNRLGVFLEQFQARAGWRGSGVSRVQLAKEAGVSEGALRQYESGDVVPKPPTMQKLAEALRVQYWVLYALADQPHWADIIRFVSSDNDFAYGEDSASLIVDLDLLEEPTRSILRELLEEA